VDSDPAEKGAGIRRALKRGADEIGWPAHRRRQMANHLGFQPCHRRQARRRFGPRVRRKFREVQARGPGLGQRCCRGTRKPGKVFDAIEVAEVGRERFRYSCLQGVGIDRLKETAGQTGGKPLDRQGLQSMLARCGRLRSFMAPGKARMGDNGVAHTTSRSNSISLDS
jgi:hypothetical protein